MDQYKFCPSAAAAANFCGKRHRVSLCTGVSPSGWNFCCFITADTCGRDIFMVNYKDNF